MSADRVLCSKPCALQNADKSYTEGTIYVYQTLARFVGRSAAAGQQKLELEIGDIKGQKRSKSNPLLMLETGTKGRPVLRFNTQDEREAVVAAITAAQTAAIAAAAAPAAAAAGVAAAAAAGGGASSSSGATAAAARKAAPVAAAAAAAAAAAGNQSARQLAQQLTPQQRQALLAENKVLSAQYKALVVESQALTEGEFWCSPAVQKVAGLTGAPTTTPRASRRGLANKLVDLARQHETAQDSGLAKLNMSAEDERQLLAEKPALKQIYDAQVGVIMSKGEFWTRYFRYYMAKRNKRVKAVSRFKQLQQNLTADSAAAVADMMGAAAQQQQEATDQEMEALFSALDVSGGLDAAARKALKRRLAPGVDLAAAADDRMTADGYGLAHNTARSDAEQIKGYTALTQQLAQDYNIHAAAVIGHVPTAAAAAGPSSSAAAAGAHTRTGTELESEMSEEELRRFRQNAGSGLEDLQAPQQQQFEELHVTNPRLYFSNIQQQQQQRQPQKQQQQQLPVKQQQQPPQQQDVVVLIRSINPHELSEQPMQPSVAQQVLVELSGGDAADAARGPAILPQEMKDFMQQQTMVVDELLRHFWSLLPVNTPEKEAKLGRIQKSLDGCYELLNRVVQQCEPVHKAALNRLVKPLWDQLDVASAAAKQIHTALAAKAQGRQRQQQQQPHAQKRPKDS